MTEQKVMNRWLVVLGALLIQLCLGAIYAWSVFTGKLTDPAGDFKFTTTQTQWIFSVGLATFAVVMVLAGKLQAKIGPRKVSIIGGVLLGVGYVLAGLLGKTFMLQLVFIGLVGGAGIGMAYVCPIAVGMRWFPDKKGFITGIAVAGFGFGALLWVQLASTWGNLLTSQGVLGTFLIYGIVFGVAVILGGLFMVYPPEGWKPAGWNPQAPKGNKPAAQPAADLLPGGMLKSAGFYLIWIAFIFSAMAGLMLIGINKLYGRDALMATGGFTDLAVASAAASTAYAIGFSIANGIGRIAWGAFSDFLGWKRSVIIMTASQGLFMVAFYFVGGNLVMLYVFLALTGFNFGGNFSLFPMATAGTFGTKNVGQNYGFMFTAYGVGGIVGPIMAGMFKDAGEGKGVEAWMLAFMISGGLCLLAAVLAALVKPAARPEAKAT
ncbi:MAG TPA: OFA family MFS transporter [Myxococcota bacterium]|nr:OFA family MFS transporter [Myxococcota bacterium]HRY94173.1 OFA family MFS transporter [Myxococcota bacterium]HSA20497.1 OFA family MFS transporter [Myxococcota bacterium]